ncbi:MAG TPA: hypothetical protein VM938_13085 [Acidimicrobiales bacterium]|nr:hypothetical protein [Acidimicrobiales bacterium]
MSSPHPDDERLSAALDGHDAEALAHAAGCRECAARLDQFRAVAASVAAPLAVPSADIAVAAALRAANVTPLHRDRRGPFALAAAALVVVVMVAVSLVNGGDDDGRSQMAASAPEAADMRAEADIGDQSDPTALAERLRGVVEPQAMADMAPTAGGGDASSGAAGATVESSPQALSARRAGAGSSPPGTPCGPTAASEYGNGLGPLVYSATLRWEGTASVALVYRIEGATGALDHRVLVMATADCRLLVAQTF